MAHYIQLDPGIFEAFLTTHGFTRTVLHNEIVYVKPFDGDKRITIKCFTSIREGDNTARPCARDAIRLVAIFEGSGKFYPLYKATRVFRVSSQESVHKRVEQRIVEAEKRCRCWLLEQKNKVKEETLVKKVKEGNSLGEYVGKVGEKLRLTIRITERYQWRGNKFLFTMKDIAGERTLAYWSEKDLLQVNELYDLSFVVKKHAIYRDKPQTQITEVAGKKVIR